MNVLIFIAIYIEYQLRCLQLNNCRIVFESVTILLPEASKSKSDVFPITRIRLFSLSAFSVVFTLYILEYRKCNTYSYQFQYDNI